MELEEVGERCGSVAGISSSSAGGADRLSALPDCLLHAIMSSLKARQAVQTCVLSTRWRHLWRSVPCLDVDLDEFRTTAPRAAAAASDSDTSDSDRSYDDDSDLDSTDSNGNNDRDREWKAFEDFAASLMQRCNVALLDSFRLRVRRSRAPMFGDRQAGGWLRRAMKYCAPGPGSSSWNLKRLYLCNVALDNRFAKHVSSVCRSLEDLELDDCTCKIHAITSRSLKSLVLRNCRWHGLSEITSPTLKSLVIDGGSNSDDCVLVIRAPGIALLCLDVPVHSFATRISVNKTPSLRRL